MRQLIRIFAYFGVIASSSLGTAAPFVEGVDAQVETDTLPVVIEQALSLGLPAADALIVRQLEDPALTEVERINLQIERMALAIQLTNWRQAASIYQEFPEEGPQQRVRRLLRAMLYWGERDSKNAAQMLTRVQEELLPQRWRAWYWVLSGMLFEEQGELGRSAESYDKALEMVTASQRVFLELLIERSKILAGAVAVTTEADIQGKIRDFSGEPIAHQYAEQLVVFYVKQGMFEEALRVLREQRQVMLLPRDQVYLDQFLALEALVEEARGGENAQILVDLLSSGQTQRVLRLALKLLIAQNETLADDFDLKVLLKRWSDRLPAHPIQADILFESAVLSLASGDYPTAQTAAETILENYPGSEKVLPATRILAVVGWELKRYRSAAVFFEQVRALTDDLGEQARLSANIADAYFLAGDYDLAAANYTRALDTGLDFGISRNVLQYQSILSLLEGGDLENAVGAIDASRSAWEGDEAELLWRLEWNLVTYLRGEGDRLRAQARVQSLLQADAVPESLGMRFQWLDIRLLFELERYPAVVDRVESLIEENEDKPFIESEVAAELLLLKGRALMFSGADLDIVVRELAGVRRLYPDSSAAPESLWIAGRAYAEQGRLGSAEDALNQLAAEYPNTRWSRMALFEAANLAEAREDFQQAASKLEAFVDQAPDDPLAFRARLNQADLLRKTGRFDEARVLLQSVLTEFVDHPELYLAEMILADALAAATDGIRLDDAVSAYTRLLDLSGIPLDLQMETRYKLGKIYERKEDFAAALEEWLECVLLYEGAAAVDLSTGPYWVARGLFEIARISEDRGDVAAAIATFEKVQALGLPGGSAAASALQRLRNPVVNLNAGIQ